MDMEQFDPQKAARVWNRVQNREPAEPLRKDQAGLIRDISAQAARYRYLSRAIQGRFGERLREYYRQQQRTAECLKGICRLSGIQPPRDGGMSAPAEPPARMLEKCCREEQRLMEEYGNRLSDPEWGRVYGKMATEGADRCCGLLEILGTMER